MGEERLRYLVAEARCYWCGTVAGTLEGGWPLMPGTLMFRRSGQQQGLALARPASPTFRCGHCGGPLFVDDFDIVLCRNVMLYLNPEKKAVAFERIAGAMAEDGWLMLGAGETVIGQTTKLGADINARGLYRIVGDGSRVEKRAGDRRAAAGG